jgi:hypothetical protein
MRKINKQNFKKLYYKIKNKVWLIPTTLMLLPAKVFAAEGSISTAEVNQATENIKNAVIKLAMPIRRNFSICKYCYYCIKNDSKCKQC